MQRSSLVIYISALCFSAALLAGWFSQAPQHTPDGHEKIRTKNLFSNVRDALRFYYREYGSVPAGDPNSVLSALVNGKNPRNIIFLELRPQKKRIYFWTTDLGEQSPDGTHVDAWGRPVIWSFDSKGYPISLRSRGPNPQDDAGQDDLVMELTVP